jgi:hypothetical protein
MYPIFSKEMKSSKDMEENSKIHNQNKLSTRPKPSEYQILDEHGKAISKRQTILAGSEGVSGILQKPPVKTPAKIKHCENCKFSTSSQIKLKKHIEFAHITNTKDQITCPECEYTCHNKEAFRSHTRQKHKPRTHHCV